MRINESEDNMLWAPYYAAVLNVLGSTGLIIPIGDTVHEATDRTTCTTVGELQAVFTYEGTGVDAFDSPPVTVGPGRIPRVIFNGTGEEADSPDAAYWTRALANMSIGAWVNFVGGDGTSSCILSKTDTVGNTREWEFLTDSSDQLQIICYDENAAANETIQTTADAGLSSTNWTFVVATYDGSANATGLNLYQDGAVVASTDADNANFVSMRDVGGTVKLAHTEATPGTLFDGSMAGGPLGPFFSQAVLTADEVLRLYQLGRVALGV